MATFMASTGSLAAALRVLFAGADRAILWRLATSVVLVAVGAVLTGLSPVALKAMIDAATGASRIADGASTVTTLTWGAAYLLATCGGRLLSDLRPPLVGTAEQHLYASLRQRFFRHLLELPLEFHLAHRTGETAQTLPQAISGYQLVIFHLINGVAPVLIELTTVTLVLATLAQPWLAMIFIGSALLHLAIMQRGQRALREAAHATSCASVEVQGRLTDALLNVETIKSFTAETSVGNRYANATNELMRCWCSLQQQRLRMGLAITANFVLMMTASLAIAIHSVSQGALTVGGFVLVNVYMLQIMRPLDMLGSAAREITQALAFIRPLMTVLEEPSEAAAAGAQVPIRSTMVPDATDQPHDVRPTVDPPSTPALSLRGLHLAYGVGPPVLRDFQLDIEAGSTVAVVGASGSGKSSLVRLLLRLYEPRHGTILIHGAAIDSMAVEELRSLIAVVPQDTVLFNDTLLTNISIGKPGATQQQVEVAARTAQLHDFIATLPDGYETIVGERGLKLSGGERQRVAIARAVLRNPQIYVFDEATSMLDSLTETSILKNLQAISAGRTTITVAHRLSSVQHAQQIVVLDRGRVVEQGTHAELLSRRGRYAAMWRAQQQHGSN